ncbi:unnamed protein product [Ranitomeya imitator]|uniref:Uncharacterized protein n=1 Tax=Ranitomeya imitator TaxID=111125 RepID=A0ABN9L8V9_9NEOB|nr:unnamed protein product [Ranitomeya imitator]
MGSGCNEKLHPMPTLCRIFTTSVGMMFVLEHSYFTFQNKIYQQKRHSDGNDIDAKVHKPFKEEKVHYKNIKIWVKCHLRDV